MKNFYIKTATIFFMLFLLWSVWSSDLIYGENGGILLLLTNSIFITIMFILLFGSYVFKGKKYEINYDIPEKFNNIYNDLYKKYIWDLEQRGKKVKLRTIMVYILLGASILAYFIAILKLYLLSTKMNLAILVIGIISIPICVFVINSNRKYKENYKKIYKNNVVKEFINRVNDKLIYKTEDISNVYELCKLANFDNKKFNLFKADDYIEGNLDEKTYVKMVDLDIKNKIGRNVEQIFQGLFAITTCDKNIGTYVKITKDKKDFFDGQDRIQMDSEEFEKYYNVYAQDKILATRILTSEIMQMLIDFYNKYQLMFEIVIKDNTIYLRFNTGEMFEPKIFLKNKMNNEVLYMYCCILEFVSDVTKKINTVVREIDI